MLQNEQDRVQDGMQDRMRDRMQDEQDCNNKEQDRIKNKKVAYLQSRIGFMDGQDRLQDEQINRKTEKERHFADRGEGGHIGRLRTRDNLVTGERGGRAHGKTEKERQFDRGSPGA
jgi:hypothetical protein